MPDLRTHVRDPFRGGCGSCPLDHDIERGSLLDTPAAHRWFELLRRGMDESVCTYQLPLSAAARPESAALGQDVIMFSSYSYVGLIGHPRLARAVNEAVERYGTSTGGVRLLTGTLDLHLELEAELARFLGVEAAAVFGSGYDANLAAIGALFGPADTAILDQYAHQSIQEGVRLAGASLHRFRHNDLEDLERRLANARDRGAERILVAVDAVFSMDGDQAPLAELIEIKDRYGAFLLVDEAHSIGAIGRTGRGVCEAQDIDPAGIDLLTGSLSKGIPSSGGYVAGAAPLKVYLQYGSAPYIFSAAVTPANTAAALEGIRILSEEPEHMARLRANTKRLRQGLDELGIDIGNSSSPIVPVLLGDEWRAYHWARHLLLEHAIQASAVTFPAVSPGQARLRLCATAAHQPEHFERLFAGLRECVELEPIPETAAFPADR